MNCNGCNETLYKCEKCGAVGCRGGHNLNCSNKNFHGNKCLTCGALNSAKPQK